MVLPYALFVLGLIITIKSGDMFVDASVWIAKKTGMPRLLIGATIVSFATTLPEFLVSIFAVLEGATGLGIGNAIGSVTSNTALVLAISIIALPTCISKREIREKGSLMILSAVTLLVISRSGVLSKAGAVPLILLALSFLFLNIASVKKNNASSFIEPFKDNRQSSTAANVLKFICGTAGIIIGARLMVDNGVSIAMALGVSESFVGITMIALGTSLPELATTLSAIRKREPAIGIGNIIGANILDLTLILSTCTLISKDGLTIEHTRAAFFPYKIHQTILIDLPVCIAALCIALLPTMISGCFKRWQGFALLFLYIAYMAYLLMGLH